MPERIVSLISSGTEILFGIGAGNEVVGRSHECDFPPAAQSLPVVTRSFVDSSADSHAIDIQVKERLAQVLTLYGVDAQILEQLRPSFIVAQSQCDVCAVKLDDVLHVVKTSPNLRDTVVLDLNPQTLDDVLEDVLRIGQQMGLADPAAAYHQELQDRIAAVRALPVERTRVKRPRVVCIEWTEPLMLAANWTPELVALAGGDNQLTVAGRHSQYHDWQEVRECDPDIIVVCLCGFDTQRTLVESQTLKQRPGWNQLSAVRGGRVYAIDGNAYINRSGPRLVDSAELLAQLFRLPHGDLGGLDTRFTDAVCRLQ